MCDELVSYGRINARDISKNGSSAITDHMYITRQKSELVVARDANLRSGLPVTRYSELTFDDCFREQFAPLDGRKKVGPYVLGRMLGEGAFSRVLTARRLEDGQQVGVDAFSCLCFL